MQLTKYLRADQQTIIQFLDMLGTATSMLSNNKRARPELFLTAHGFIQGFINNSFFNKEDLLLAALEQNGFPVNDGPIAAMRIEQGKSRESAEHMRNAAQGWLDGDDEARGEVGWAASGYTMTIRQHLERLNNRIYPLLEQNISGEDQDRITVGLNQLARAISERGETEKYSQLVVGLQEELSDWK